MLTYVVATDQCSSVRQFCTDVYTKLGFKELTWNGSGLDEKLSGKL